MSILKLSRRKILNFFQMYTILDKQDEMIDNINALEGAVSVSGTTVTITAGSPTGLSVTALLKLYGLSTTQITALGTVAAGSLVFDTTVHKMKVYNGSAWETVTSA